jgi:uncharacterized protein (DUF427 family)
MRTEASDKWVRAYVGDVAVVDSRRPLLFWEDRFPVPGYAFPPEDVRTDLLTPSQTKQTVRNFHTPKGPVKAFYDLELDGRRLEHVAWERDDPALEGLLVLTWEPGVLDRWTEEDEVVVAHPRDPHKRVEAIASSRHVEISVGGTVLADSHAPVLLFETHLPTRYYLPREDVRLDVLVPSANHTTCPYKGVAEEYWSLPGEPGVDNIAWSYADPYPAVQRVAGRIAFYNELVDITVDGEPQERPRSIFSKAGNRPTSG